MIRILLGTGLSLLALGAAQASTPPDPASYPKLDARQLGHIGAIARLADQPESDWSGMGSQEPGQGGFDSYRYQLAMMSYTLALANYRYTPAYRELDQQLDRKLIDKMLQFDVWGFWEQTSRGAKGFDPDLKVLGEGWIDPVKDQNIMYSGHLFQMVTTHQMLYGDDRYARPGAIKFVYNPVGRGLGPQVFSYDTKALAETLARQFEESGWKGIQCEPNAIFPECNQHPLLGFALYDRAHGTDYFPKISTAFKRQFDDLNYIDPKTSSFMGMYLVRQKVTLQHGSGWSDGWAGSFMHGWDKPDVERIYPIQKSRLLVKLPDGTTTTKSVDGNYAYSWDHGFFTLLAAEVGDAEVRDRMLAYDDKYWSPRWIDGALVYPRQDKYRLADDGANVWRRVQPLTGNGLIGLARLNGKDGLYNLFNRPLSPTRFREPTLSGVDFPQVVVSRAVYDGARKALIVTLAPGAGARPGRAHWTVEQVDPAKSYELWAGKRRLGRIDPKAAGKLAEGASYSVAGDRVTIDVALPREQDFVLVEA